MTSGLNRDIIVSPISHVSFKVTVIYIKLIIVLHLQSVHPLHTDFLQVFRTIKHLALSRELKYFIIIGDIQNLSHKKISGLDIVRVQLLL